MVVFPGFVMLGVFCDVFCVTVVVLLIIVKSMLIIVKSMLNAFWKRLVTVR